tara:strand:+ start:4815 stop:5543 length:729 start_codon:yes stop_codon:yes gene_type:complete
MNELHLKTLLSKVCSFTFFIFLSINSYAGYEVKNGRESVSNELNKHSLLSIVNTFSRLNYVYDSGSTLENPQFVEEQIDRLEYSKNNKADYMWIFDTQFWIGTDNHQLLLNSKIELDRRYDENGDKSRKKLSGGLFGLSPFWFYTSEVNSCISCQPVPELEIEYKWLIQSHSELSVFGKNDLIQSSSKLLLSPWLCGEITSHFESNSGVNWEASLNDRKDIFDNKSNKIQNYKLQTVPKLWF